MKILSIDGGGIKGFLPALVLARMEADAERHMGQMVDMLAGTSTGAILALGLAAGISACEMAAFYEKLGPSIFRRTWRKRLRSLFGLADEQYDNDGLRTGLEQLFGPNKLSSLTVPCMVVTYDIEARKTVFLTSWDAKRGIGRDFTLVDAAMCSTAAPTYFEPFPAVSVGGDKLRAIDGGVAANDPALCAVVEAIKRGCDLNSISLLSLGTGREERPYLLSKARNWGLVDWARPLLDILFSAASDVTDHHCKMLLGDRYVRLQQDFSTPVGMDDCSDAAFAAMRMYAAKIADSGDMSAAIKLLMQ